MLMDSTNCINLAKMGLACISFPLLCFLSFINSDLTVICKMSGIFIQYVTFPSARTAIFSDQIVSP